MAVEEFEVAVGGRAVRCLAAGEGAPLLLPHGLGERLGPGVALSGARSARP